MTDLAEQDKPWRLPGAVQTDYFNYGFDEFTWTTYCIRQKTMTSTLTDQKSQTANFETFFGLPPTNPAITTNTSSTPSNAPTGAAAAAAAAAMPMPSEGEMMQIMQQMMAQGITDPSQLDMNTFMQMMGGMPGMPGSGGAQGAPAAQQQGGVPQGPAAQYQQGGGQWGGGGGGGGYGGRGGGRGGRRW